MTLALLAAYAIGSVPIALLLTRRWSAQDLRLVGSGNLGAANAARASGMAAGVVVALLDMSKGALSVALARHLSAAPSAPAAAGLAAVIVHVYPVWLRFRGGKGVATACGAFSVLSPIATAPAASVFLLTVWATRYVSLGSVLASLTLPTLVYAAGSSAPVVAAAGAAAALIVFRHRSNLARLRAGLERRLGAAERAGGDSGIPPG